jgi:hypothetical protein
MGAGQSDVGINVPVVLANANMATKPISTDAMTNNDFLMK